ncbi:MAG: hypothetical protein ACREM8_12010, partial [Vulcanimicrobiaceae bacterium]
MKSLETARSRGPSAYQRRPPAERIYIGPIGLALPTLRRRLAAIAVRHTAAGQETPVRTPITVVTRSRCESHRAFITAELVKDRHGIAIYQDLVEHHGYTGSYDAVKRLIRKLSPKDVQISCRFETEPGQEAQVDYGEGALTRDPRTGKYRRPRLFVMTLSNSRRAYRTTVWKSSTQIWCELHEKAFAHFG